MCATDVSTHSGMYAGVTAGAGAGAGAGACGCARAETGSILPCATGPMP